MTAPTITALPIAPSRSDPETFSDRGDALLGALGPFVTEANTLGSYFETNAGSTTQDASLAAASATAAANSATAALNSAANAGGVAWVSGTSYSVGTVVYSAVNYQNYRAITTHSGETTDPSEDGTNWTGLGVATAGLSSQTATLTTTTETSIATFSKTDYSSLELTVVADDGTDRTLTKLLVVHNGTIASSTQYGEVNTNTQLATYDVDISADNIRLLATSSSANSTEYTVKENLLEFLSA